MSNTTFRKLKKKDAARIKCQGHYRNMCECPANATHCMTVEWDTGNTKGISFFYMCEGGYESHHLHA